jgi:hypothetical protein
VVNTPEAELSTTLLCLPAVAPARPSAPPPPPADRRGLRQAGEQGDADAQAQRATAVVPQGQGDDAAASHLRFVAFADLVSKSLLLCGGDKVIGLVHFHPLYDRSKVTGGHRTHQL